MSTRKITDTIDIVALCPYSGHKRKVKYVSHNLNLQNKHLTINVILNYYHATNEHSVELMTAPRYITLVANNTTFVDELGDYVATEDPSTGTLIILNTDYASYTTKEALLSNNTNVKGEFDYVMWIIENHPATLVDVLMGGIEKAQYYNRYDIFAELI